MKRVPAILIGIALLGACSSELPRGVMAELEGHYHQNHFVYYSSSVLRTGAQLDSSGRLVNLLTGVKDVYKFTYDGSDDEEPDTVTADSLMTLFDGLDMKPFFNLKPGNVEYRVKTLEREGKTVVIDVAILREEHIEFYEIRGSDLQKNLQEAIRQAMLGGGPNPLSFLQ